VLDSVCECLKSRPSSKSKSVTTELKALSIYTDTPRTPYDTTDSNRSLLRFQARLKTRPLANEAGVAVHSRTPTTKSTATKLASPFCVSTPLALPIPEHHLSATKVGRCAMPFHTFEFARHTQVNLRRTHERTHDALPHQGTTACKPPSACARKAPDPPHRRPSRTARRARPSSKKKTAHRLVKSKSSAQTESGCDTRHKRRLARKPPPHTPHNMPHESTAA
jgi:hypothetical protein